MVTFKESIKPFISGGDYACDFHLDMIKRSFLGPNEEYFGLDMDPDYQRGHVWSMEQRTKYIEFLLRGGESSRDIYWNCPGFRTYERTKTLGDLSNKLTIVDGKQRVTSVLMFVDNEVPVFGHYLDEFDDPLRAIGISGPHLRFHVNNLVWRKDLYQWYLDLNDGGVVHTTQEIERVRGLLKEVMDAPSERC